MFGSFDHCRIEMFLTYFLILFLAQVKSSPTTVSKNQKTYNLQILHNNDMHARFEETSRRSGICRKEDAGKNCIGGFGRLAHVIREARKKAAENRGPPVIFLNAGDTYTGSAWFVVHRAKIVADFLNALEPDAVGLGNHEFDLGVNGLLPFVQSANFPIVASNADFTHEPRLKYSNVRRSVVLDVRGHKVGIIGYLTPETRYVSHVERVRFSDEVDGINQESQRLDKEGVKLIIALGHSGYKTDMRIAKDCPLVDVVVGGHTNTFLWNGPKIDLEEPEGPYPTIIEQPNGKKVPVVQAFAYTKYLGILNLTITETGDVIEFDGLPMILESNIHQERDLLEKLDSYRKEVDELETVVVGSSKVDLIGDVPCRKRECNFGNLVADAFVAYHLFNYSGTYWTDVPLGIINGGSIRNSIENSRHKKITRKEIVSAVPFYSPLISLSLNGSDLWETFEISVRSTGRTSLGEFLQVSGFKVTYDLSKPVGKRVVQLEVRCGNCEEPKYEPVVLHKTYRIITTSFLNDAGDGHFVIQERGFDKVQEYVTDVEAIEWYMKQYSPVYPEIQDRIIILPSSSCKAKISLSLITMLLVLVTR